MTCSGCIKSPTAVTTVTVDYFSPFVVRTDSNQCFLYTLAKGLFITFTAGYRLMKSSPITANGDIDWWGDLKPFLPGQYPTK